MTQKQTLLSLTNVLGGEYIDRVSLHLALLRAFGLSERRASPYAGWLRWRARHVGPSGTDRAQYTCDLFQMAMTMWRSNRN